MTLTSAEGTRFNWLGVKTINHRTARQGLWRVLSSYSFIVRDEYGIQGRRGPRPQQR